ncbi:hypothetical protein B296_00003270 [Ensete ventricosum]|uniref:Uncharacterized protein n=1 Tax=Ensete ventricosum TaxID=4639 RepID=A0A427B8N5_ENSVE|nr:hypothetical protein B296_00003270 [Ensete ventricosum]
MWNSLWTSSNRWLTSLSWARNEFEELNDKVSDLGRLAGADKASEIPSSRPAQRPKSSEGTFDSAHPIVKLVRAKLQEKDLSSHPPLAIYNHSHICNYSHRSCQLRCCHLTLNYNRPLSPLAVIAAALNLKIATTISNRLIWQIGDPYVDNLVVAKSYYIYVANSCP